LAAKNYSFKVLSWIAWRNLASRKNRHGLSFMTIVSIFGVTLGVAVLIIVLSVMGGFEHELKQKMLKGQPHLEVFAENALAGFSLQKYPISTFKKRMPEAAAIEPFTQADVVLKQGKHMAAVVLFGVDPKFDRHLWGFNDAMVGGRLEDIGTTHYPIIRFEKDNMKLPGIVLGDGLAEQLGADLGDEIVVLSPAAASSSQLIGGGTISRHYVLAGTFHTGLFNYDGKWAVVSLDEGRKFMADYDPSLDEEQYVSGVAINSKDPYDIDKLAAKVKKMNGLVATTWKDSNAALLFALKLEKYTMGAILMLIVLVAAFSISGTMMMTVFHKKRQVCLLRSIGMSKLEVARLFMMQGMAIGLVGILIGLAIGVSACVLIYQLRYVEMPTNIMSLRALPVKFLPLEYGIICLSAWGLSLFGAVYPALIASHQNPSSGLRY
jgi:lipoprotein-releasing system permease protein